MSWTLVVALGVGLFAIRFAGLLAPAGSELSPAVRMLAETMPLAIVAALVFTQTFTSLGAFVIDTRALGVLAALIVAHLRAPLIVAVVVGVAVTSVARATGL